MKKSQKSDISVSKTIIRPKIRVVLQVGALPAADGAVYPDEKFPSLRAQRSNLNRKMEKGDILLLSFIIFF
jgi:hypothetical protein